MRQDYLERLIHGASLIPSLDEVARYRDMRADYIERCRQRPAANRYNIVLMVCANGFGLSADRLIEHDRSADIAESRQKLMAFARVVSLDTARINTWQGIARTFHRSHSTVIHATRKFGKEIAAALEVSQ